MQGRALGIHCIFATQRPSGVQLSTEIRAALLTKISFCIGDKRSREMAGIQDTGHLNVGEFKIRRVGSESTETLKAFYTDRVQSWEVFEMLKSKIGGNNNVKRNNVVNFKKDI